MRFTLDQRPFSGCTGRGVTVAVLDSGIHAGHPHVGDVRGGMSFVIDDADAGVHCVVGFVDQIGHGTAVAAAIREKSPGVELLAGKIFHRQLATNVDVLARAIEWAADEGAQLINLSLGTPNLAHAARLDAAVQYAASRGALVVSAHEADGAERLPGALSGVAGVSADSSMERDELEVVVRAEHVPCFRASPYPRPIPNVPRERNLSGVSFAVANVTGFLARAAEAADGNAFDALRRIADTSTAAQTNQVTRR